MAKLDMTLLTLSTIIAAAFPIINAYYFSRVIDEVVKISQSNLSSINEIGFSDRIVQLFLISLAVALITSFFNRTQSLYRTKFRTLHFPKFIDSLAQKISSLDIQQFEDPKFADSIQKANDNIWKVNAFVHDSIHSLTQLIGVIISGAIVLGLSSSLAFALVIISIPSALIYIQFVKEWWDFYNTYTEERRTRWWINDAMTDEKMIFENKVVGATNHLNSMLVKSGRKLFRLDYNVHKHKYSKDIYELVLIALKNILIPVVLLTKLIAGINTGTFTIGDFTFLNGRASDFSNKLTSLLGELVSIFDASLAISKVREVFEADNKLTKGMKRIPLNKAPKIEFKNVSFKYPSTKIYVLKNINITLNPGDEIALVGENGSGKTTLIKLLLRFYDPDKGELLVNGVNAKEIDIQTYYKTIGVLFQDYNIYNFLTTNENITISKKPRKTVNKEVREATKVAEADKFIERLELKYKQKLTKRFSGGTNLSKGQEQKIALARMFYRNAPVLILDEPTASIDAIAEHNIFKRIYDFMTDKTVIIISHRFSTVRNAKKIYVLDKGKIVEEGSHEELIKINGKYTEAFNLQAEGYTKKGNRKAN